MNYEIFEKEKSIKFGWSLEFLTLGSNLIEGVAAFGFGIIAGSVVLVGFGIDLLVAAR